MTRENGTVVITGGTKKVRRAVAEHLAKLGYNLKPLRRRCAPLRGFELTPARAVLAGCHRAVRQIDAPPITK
jgi:NAD(P)-dependent dehydrogenase (short-subunit alcohol dehydrogenase family)